MDLRVSIGMVELAELPSSIESCLRTTRAVLSTSKSRGKNRVVCEGLASVRSRESERDAQLAFGLVSGKWLRPLFQPIVELATGETQGYEALVRGPQGPLHSPAAIFRLAREQGLQPEVDLAAMRAAIRAESVPLDRMLYLNVFPSTLLRYAGHEIQAIVREHGGPVCLELNEQEDLRDPQALLRPLSRLRDAGSLLALDDVGSGRSSVFGVICLEPDVIKLDRGLVTGAHSDPARRRIYAQIVAVAHTIGAQVVAEGIEDDADRAVACDLGVEFGQGYYWGRPTHLPARSLVDPGLLVPRPTSWSQFFPREQRA